MGRIVGLEALFSIIKNDLKSREDCAVAAIHCILLNSDLLCSGLSEDDADSATELLPENWNSNQDLYSLRYVSKDFKKSYLLKIAKAGSNLHVDFGAPESGLLSTTISTDEFVSDEYKKFSEAFKGLDVLQNKVKESILKSLEAKHKSPQKKDSTKKKATTPTKEPNQETPKVDNPPHMPQPIPAGGRSDLLRSRGEGYAFPVIGGNDLDPLGRSEGSMFFDPFNRPSRSGLGPFIGGRGGRFGSGSTDLPPGAVPPGARFDPFSPINPGRFNPDPDHFRSDYDNMFM